MERDTLARIVRRPTSGKERVRTADHGNTRETDGRDRAHMGDPDGGKCGRIGRGRARTFAELLTLEARLALEQDTVDLSTDESVTHYRRSEAGNEFLTKHMDTSDRLAVERPYGRLPVDRKNRGLQRTYGWNMQHLVREMGHKLNPQLLRWLREHPIAASRCRSDNNPTTYRRTCWRLHDRLSERDMVRLVMAHKTGMATKALAERYGINVKSVRKLICLSPPMERTSGTTLGYQ